MPIEFTEGIEATCDIPTGFLRLLIGIDTKPRFMFVHYAEIASYGPDLRLSAKDQEQDGPYTGPYRTPVRLRGIEQSVMVVTTCASLSREISNAQRDEQNQRNTVHR